LDGFNGYLTAIIARWKLSNFTVRSQMKWDITTDPKINTYDGCSAPAATQSAVIDCKPAMVKEVQEGMRLVCD